MPAENETSLRRSYDDILSRLDSILADDSELTPSGDLAVAVDGLLLKLTLWGDDIGLDEGIFELIEKEHTPIVLATNFLLNDVLNELMEFENSFKLEADAETGDPQDRDIPEHAFKKLEQSVSELVQHVEPFQSLLADAGPVKRAIEEANKTLASRAGSIFPTKYPDSGQHSLAGSFEKSWSAGVETNKSSAGLSTWVTPLPRHMQQVSFVYSIKLIKPNDAVKPRFSNPPNPLWLPPDQMNAFTVLERGDWYQWSPGKVQEVPSNERSTIRLLSTVSLIWCPDRQAFLQVPYDCTERNVAGCNKDGIPLEWEELSFHHKTNTEGHCISMLGYQYERNQLAARSSETWMPQLLPHRYQCPENPEYPGSCHLAGELSILVGLAAFSTTPKWMHWVIKNCFNNGPTSAWTPHDKPEGRNQQRGLVVRVGVQSLYEVARLKAWQNGDFGPIIS